MGKEVQGLCSRKPRPTVPRGSGSQWVLKDTCVEVSMAQHVQRPRGGRDVPGEVPEEEQEDVGLERRKGSVGARGGRRTL